MNITVTIPVKVKESEGLIEPIHRDFILQCIKKHLSLRGNASCELYATDTGYKIISKIGLYKYNFILRNLSECINTKIWVVNESEVNDENS